MMVTPLLVQAHQQREDLLDLRMREPGHRLVGDQQPRLRRHGAREFELAHLDLGEVARQLARAFAEADVAQQLLAALLDLRRREMPVRAPVDRVEQRHAHIVGDRHADERTRQLEAAREPEPGAACAGSPSRVRPSNLTVPVSWARACRTGN